MRDVRDGYYEQVELVEHPFDPYAASWDMLTRTFFSIIENSEVYAGFPENLLPNLRKIGNSTLGDNESQSFIQLHEDGSLESRRFTKNNRERFWNEHKRSTTERRMLLGEVISLERGVSDRFTFRDDTTGKKISGPCGDHWDDLYQALDKSEANRFWRLHADVEVGYSDELLQIVELQSVEVLDMTGEHWLGRFKELSTGPVLVDSSSLERSDLIISEVVRSNLDEPWVFPSGEGGIDLVWDLPRGRITVYVEDDEDYEVELVPDGPLNPYATTSPGDVVDKVREYLGV